MSVLENVGQWVRGKFSKDPYIDGSPAEKIREAHVALKGLSQDERAHRIEHVAAYTKYFYGEDSAPKEVQSQLQLLQTRADNLKSVDAAREVLDRYGGPPTQATINEALERSEVERQRIRESAQQQIETPREQPVISEPVREKTLESSTLINASKISEPWMAQSGWADNLSREHLASARRSYSEWEHKDRYDFANYVSYVQEKWAESRPEYVQQTEMPKDRNQEIPERFKERQFMRP